MMETLTANEAKTQFGDMLLKAQRTPVQINRNGKAVAVVISMDEFEQMESLKTELLKARVQQAKLEIEAGKTVEGENFFDELLSGQHDD